MQAVLVWGNQLSIDDHSALQSVDKKTPVIMIESASIVRRFKFHKQKIVFVLASMRAYRDELQKAGYDIHYVTLEEAHGDDYFTSLEKLAKKLGFAELVAMRASDRTPQKNLQDWCKRHDIKLSITANTLFLTRPADFADWAEGRDRQQMEQFYRWQRKRLNILMQENGKPEGNRWNYDSENRKPLPAKMEIPALQGAKPTEHVEDVLEIVDQEFSDHPGDVTDWWLPTDRKSAEDWLQIFMEERFENFGDYEDAMRKGETFLFHSCLSALMNIGWLHPRDVVDAALGHKKASLATREGFIRQIIGWREFMFSLYHYKPADWVDDNYLNHRRKLEDYWWRLDGANEPPIQDVLQRIKRYGYAHHIERLMVLGNFMLISRYSPREVYDWFMCMFVDAYEWVMVPNVIGMSQYADGGQDNGSFATKPYISGSNYLQKMGKWWPSTAAAKESSFTPLYWEFLDTHRDKLEQNFRLRPLYARRK